MTKTIKPIEKEDVIKMDNVGIRGKWEWELADNGWANHICSECGYTKNTDIHVSIGYRYCPMCGAYMGE